MSEPRTPQVPMVDQNGQPFYPLTQYNQIVMPGGERWDGNPGSSVELDATLKVAGKAADAGAVGTAISELKNEKADKAGWTAGKNVVTDENGNLVTEDKPTIPTIPSALPNPFAVTINGQSYDGSEALEMTVSSLPNGGTAGQVLSKKSDANQDAEWKDPSGGLSMELIWEPPTLDSEFPAQTISIDLTEYALCYILYRGWRGDASHCSHVVKKGYKTAILDFVTSGNTNYFVRRYVTPMDTGFVFSDATMQSGSNNSTNNDLITAIRIYGIKGVSE